MTIKDLKDRNLVILECISGSKAYGLDTPASDTDIKGVFLLPKSDFYGLSYIPQISNESNDIVYYELGRYMELLLLNNPNILELLNTPKESILYKHPNLEEINSKLILSKLCKNTFGKFALSQIKKAKGLKKKIGNPIDKARKSVLEFCYVNFENGSTSLLEYLQKNKWDQKDCGLVNIAHMKNVYGLYHSKRIDYEGIIKGEASDEVSLSSIPKGEVQECLLYFNKDGYSSYCKEYREYWDWVHKRNENRYQTTKEHGKNYDSKNMMHTFRLLEMAIEIARDEKVNVKRDNRNFLLDVKMGRYEFKELINLANDKQNEMEIEFNNSSLQEQPNIKLLKEMTFKLREKFYLEKENGW